MNVPVIRVQPESGSGQAPTIGVVVPAHQAEGTLSQCLQGIVAAGFPIESVLVVNDRSTDKTVEIAANAGAHVLHVEQGAGASNARNLGAGQASSDVICFVDADVVLHTGMARRLARHFADNPRLDAVFGAYDDDPPVRTCTSRYRNLLHHFVHAENHGRASTFWTGFGAVKRQRFEQLGGFDSRTENIEDVDFGMRLAKAGGEITLDTGLLCTHLKNWNFVNMVRTDYAGRAIPWSRLLLFREGLRGDLNTASKHRWNAGLAGLTAVSGLLSLTFPAAGAVALLSIVTFLTVNMRFFRLLARKGGLRLVLAGIPLHIIHYWSALAGFFRVAVLEAAPTALGLRRRAPGDVHVHVSSRKRAKSSA